jgi:hypothetical protein
MRTVSTSIMHAVEVLTTLALAIGALVQLIGDSTLALVAQDSPGLLVARVLMRSLWTGLGLLLGAAVQHLGGVIPAFFVQLLDHLLGWLAGS